MKRFISMGVTVLLFVVLSSCESTPFERVGWDKKVDGVYTERVKMLDNLLESHSFESMDVRTVIGLLGLPDYYFDHTAYQMVYFIQSDYNENYDLVYSKNLIFKLDRSVKKVDFNTPVVGFEIQENQLE